MPSGSQCDRAAFRQAQSAPAQSGRPHRGGALDHHRWSARCFLVRGV